MRKRVLLISGLVISSFALSQVGINNQNPRATLDITAKTTDGSKAEGFIAPRLTGDQIKAGDAQYGAAQTGAILYATSGVTTPVSGSKTESITSAGYYYFNGTRWARVGTGTSTAGSTFNLRNITSGSYTLLPGDGYITVDQNASGPTVDLNLSDSQAYTPGQVVYISNLSFNNVQLNIVFNGNVTANNFISQTNINYVPSQYQGILIYRGGLSSSPGSWALIQSNL